MKPKRDERFAIRFSRAEKRSLEKMAREKDLTASQIVRRAIRQVLVQQEEVTR